MQKNFQKFGLTTICLISFIFVLTACESPINSQNMTDDFLPVDEAFVFSVKETTKNSVTLQWKVADGYHLYKNQFRFSVEPDGNKISNIDYPKGEMFKDKALGTLESYKGTLNITLNINNIDSNNITLKSRYQGCADVGLCYPPETKVTTLKI